VLDQWVLPVQRGRVRPAFITRAGIFLCRNYCSFRFVFLLTTNREQMPLLWSLAMRGSTTRVRSHPLISNNDQMIVAEPKKGAQGISNCSIGAILDVIRTVMTLPPLLHRALRHAKDFSSIPRVEVWITVDCRKGRTRFQVQIGGRDEEPHRFQSGDTYGGWCLSACILGS
jgi:hypothetical protein